MAFISLTCILFSLLLKDSNGITQGKKKKKKKDSDLISALCLNLSVYKFVFYGEVKKELE